MTHDADCMLLSLRDQGVGRREASGAQVAYVRDHLGSVRVAIEPAGTVRSVEDYYPFGLEMAGRVYVQGAPTEENFTGYEKDAETGMNYAGARYYMPALGSWTSTDPMGQYASPYVYSGNNPVMLTDPDGMWAGIYIDEQGNQIGDDGEQNDDVHVVSSQSSAAAIISQSGGSISLQDLANLMVSQGGSALDGVITLPSLESRQQASIYYDQNGTALYDFEHGGIMFGDSPGGFVNADPGPRVTGSRSRASMDVTKREGVSGAIPAALSGLRATGDIHSHTYDTGSRANFSDPSGTDMPGWARRTQGYRRAGMTTTLGYGSFLYNNVHGSVTGYRGPDLKQFRFPRRCGTLFAL